MKSRPSIPAVVEHAYGLWLWLDARVEDLPARARASLGVRVLDTALDLLDELLTAAYAPASGDARVLALRSAGRRVALLRFLLRGLRDRRHLSLEQHAHAAGELDAIGRMVGGWMRASP